MPAPATVISITSVRSGRSDDVLVVDDNAANLTALQLVLEGIGGQVVRAQSGEEALRILLERDFAVILLDVKMPTMSGFETARLIRDRKRSRHTPIIFVTAYSRDDSEVVAAYQLGAVDFLFKPLAADVLRAKVGVFVELQRRAQEVTRQEHLLREHEHQRVMEEERQRWKDQDMQRRIEEMAEADRHKDQFLAVLAHELRNPLAPLVTGLELLRMRLPADTDEVVQRTRERMERQVEHLRRLVDDLLDVSRIRSGRVDLRKEPVSIQAILDNAIVAARPSIDARGHRLTVDLPPTPVLLDADGVRLTQVFTNLLTNAANYTDAGGAIGVRCELGADTLKIIVADSGRGIAAELLPRIFDMFVQARPGGGGLGLGLAVARRLVEMHGGSLSASSDGEQGSEFVVRLPLEILAVSQARGAVEPARIATRPLRVVLVEDSEDIRELTRELLVDLGHDVEVAENGETGAELILRLRPDVALVDIGMPVLDGYGLASRVRGQPGGGQVRLVAMTGFGMECDRRKVTDAGFDAHLIKPADAASLMKVLSNEEAI
jgi:signal transduction histidine kinase